METYEQVKNEEYRQKTKALLDILPDYCTGYINSLNDKQPRTKLSYLQDLKMFYEFLIQNNPKAKGKVYADIDLDFLNNLGREDIVEYDNWLESYYMPTESGTRKHYTNSASGRKRKLISLRSLYSYLVNTAEYINNNPTLKVALPKVKEKTIRTIESDELPKILKTYDLKFENAVKLKDEIPEENQRLSVKNGPAVVKRDLAIFMLFLGTGLRISELVGINTLDIKWDLARINIVRKGGDHDYIYMSDAVLDIVYDYFMNYRAFFSDFDEEDALFLSNKHCRISTVHIERTMNEYIESALGKNSGITPHKLRATYGTKYYRETGDIYETAQVLGHKSVETTRRHYAKPSEKAKQKMRSMDVYKIED